MGKEGEGPDSGLVEQEYISDTDNRADYRVRVVTEETYKHFIIQGRLGMYTNDQKR
jgi:hypothetical protein